MKEESDRGKWRDKTAGSSIKLFEEKKCRELRLLNCGNNWKILCVLEQQEVKNYWT